MTHDNDVTLRGRGAGGPEGHAPPPPTFRRKCTFLRPSYRIELPNSVKLPGLQLKFDDQIAGNYIFKVPVFNATALNHASPYTNNVTLYKR